MKQDSTKDAALAAEGSLFDNWFEAIEDGVRNRVREFIETMLEEELAQTLARPRYEPRRVSWRLQLLRGWSHDEANPTLFT
jgi:hypothetical protein